MLFPALSMTLKFANQCCIHCLRNKCCSQAAFPFAEVHAQEEIKTPTEIVIAKRRQRVLH